MIIEYYMKNKLWKKETKIKWVLVIIEVIVIAELSGLSVEAVRSDSNNGSSNSNRTVAV